MADVWRFLWKTKLNQRYFINPWRCNNKKPFFCMHVQGIYFVINYGLFVGRFISWIKEKCRQEWGLGVRFSPGFPPSCCLKMRRILQLKGQCLESGIRDGLALQYTTVSPTPHTPHPFTVYMDLLFINHLPCFSESPRHGATPASWNHNRGRLGW